MQQFPRSQIIPFKMIKFPKTIETGYWTKCYIRTLWAASVNIKNVIFLQKLLLEHLVKVSLGKISYVKLGSSFS